KDRTGPDLDERRVYIQYVTEPGDPFGQIKLFLPTRRPSTVDHSLVASVRRKMHLSLIFLEFLSEMDLEVLGLPSKISAERAVLRVLSEESSRECPMRIAFDPQRRFDCPPVLEVRLNTSCRDEIIPILKGLQHIYSQPELRDELLDAVAQDVNGTSSADLGRPGMTYWSILV